MAKSVCQLPTRLSPPTPLRLPPSDVQVSSALFLGQGGHGYLWCLRDNTIFTLERASGKRLSSWTDRNAQVTLVCELQVSATHSYLLVAMTVGGRSVVGVLHPTLPNLFRAVEVPHQVTSLHAVSPGNLSTPGLFSQSVLRQFTGIAAIGCRGGHVYLVDLALDSSEMAKPSLSRPSGLRLLSPTQGPIGAELNQAIASGNHVGLEITGVSVWHVSHRLY